MGLAQGPQHSDTDEARTCGPRSWVEHSTTEPLRSSTKAFSFKSLQNKISPYFSTSTQKNRLNETVVLSTPKTVDGAILINFVYLNQCTLVFKL